MGDRLEGRVAVITGGGGSIGRGIALAFASEGARVVVNDLGTALDGSGASTLPADRVVAEITEMGGKAVTSYDSVTTLEGGNNIIKTAVDNFGRIDILVNNAGILRDRMVFNMTPEEWDAVIKVHLYGHYNCTKPAAVLMRQQRSGRIINMSSASGLGNSGQANYSAAKEGIIGFTRTVARDMGRYGVTCNAIRPGASTRLTTTDEVMRARQFRAERGITGTGRQTSDEPAESAPERALRDPDDVAPFVVWLATDAAVDVSGYDFAVSGGHVALYSQPTAIKSIDKDGRWTLDELDSIVPTRLTKDLVNPSPPQSPK